MILLHRAKFICSDVLLFNNEVKNLCRMFLQNDDPYDLFDFGLSKFENIAKKTEDE